MPDNTLFTLTIHASLCRLTAETTYYYLCFCGDYYRSDEEKELAEFAFDHLRGRGSPPCIQFYQREQAQQLRAIAQAHGWELVIHSPEAGYPLSGRR